jgi:hypothetical protein
MTEEYSSLMKNNTQYLVPLPKGHHIFHYKWVYRDKYGIDGCVDNYRARLLAKVFSRVERIDYSKTFSCIVKMNSLHLVISLVVSQGWSIYQMHVKSVFMHGELNEEIYMDHPPRFV